MYIENKKKVRSFGTRGRHFIVDYWGCNVDLINDAQELLGLLDKSAIAAGATVLTRDVHKFDGKGVTAVCILAESHISIHSWPERGYAAVDIYTCGNCDPLLAHHVIEKKLAASSFRFKELERGRNVEANFATLRSSRDRSAIEAQQDWFVEDSVPGSRDGTVRHSFAISSLIVDVSTQYQHCQIFDTPLYGRVLVLDGIVQLSTADEFIYHDMLVHPVMFTHDSPRNVLIVGGGDGGALREVLRHNPDRVVMIDIDEEFVRCAQQNLPSLSQGAFEDARLELVFGDASVAADSYSDAFDVVIIDCNDAVGTSAPLFEEAFYQSIAKVLKEGGVCSILAGAMLDAEFLCAVRTKISKYLGKTVCSRLTMPSYHGGEFVFMMATKSNVISEVDLQVLQDRQTTRGIETSYWSPAMHFASQVFAPSSPLGGVK